MAEIVRNEVVKLIKKRIGDIKERTNNSSLGKDKTHCGGHYGIGTVWIGFKDRDLGPISVGVHKKKGHDLYKENMKEAEIIFNAKDDLEFLLGLVDLFDLNQEIVYCHINSNYNKI